LDGATLGWIGGIVGSVIGVIGGAIGTYFSIANAKGPREKALMKKAAVVVWLALSLFLLLLLTLPKPYNWLMWIPYGVFLPWGIRCINRKQREIRDDEG